MASCTSWECSNVADQNKTLSNRQFLVSSGLLFCQDSNPPTPYLGRRIVPKKHAFVHLGIALTLFESLLNGFLLHFSVNNDLSIYVDVVDGDFNAFKSDEIIHLTFDWYESIRVSKIICLNIIKCNEMIKHQLVWT